MDERVPAGHRSVPHTADVQIEAWAPTREDCLAEVVRALVDTFAEVPAGAPGTPLTFRVEPDADEDMLVEVLDEVIYQMDTTGRLPAAARVVPAGGGLAVTLELTDRVRLIGAVPKAVALHELRFTGGPTGWSCRVTLDV